MKRRQFLKHLATTPIMTASMVGSMSQLAFIKQALAATGKTLIVIFQRGGCDGLNLVVPYADDDYYTLRPNIAIAPPGAGSDTTIDLDGFFGLHPALAPFQNIFEQGDMGIFPTVHYDNATRSHFRSQDLIETSAIVEPLTSGWLNRYLTTHAATSSLQATSVGSLALSLQGDISVSVLPDLANIESSFDISMNQRLSNIFQQAHTGQPYRELLNKQGQLMLENVDELLSLNDFSSYSPANGALYPDSEYGQRLKQLAFLIKSGVGLEVCTVDIGGWDTHINQGGATGTQATQLDNFSKGIAALYDDLGPGKMQDVVILTMTEFGRTAKQNASLGTDHGNASSWFVIGGNINGGIYGDWPGLAPENLYMQRYLQHTVDYRDIFAEVLTGHFGVSAGLNSIIPNHTPSPIGFL